MVEELQWLDRNKNAELVFRLISEEEEVTPLQLLQASKLECWLLKHILDRLQKEGLVRRSQAGFALTEKGRNLKEKLKTTLELKKV